MQSTPENNIPSLCRVSPTTMLQCSIMVHYNFITFTTLTFHSTINTTQKKLHFTAAFIETLLEIQFTAKQIYELITKVTAGKLYNSHLLKLKM